MKSLSFILIAMLALPLLMVGGCEKDSLEEGDYLSNQANCPCGKEYIIDSLINNVAIIIENKGEYTLSTNKDAIDRYQRNKIDFYLKNTEEVYFPCQNNLPEKYRKDGLKVLFSGNVFDCPVMSDPESFYTKVGHVIQLSYIKNF